MAPLKTLSARILAARKIKKIKQEVLSAHVGCSRSYISKLESGLVVPSTTLASKLEKSLQLKKGALVGLLLKLKQKEASLKKSVKLAILKAREAALSDGKNAA